MVDDGKMTVRAVDRALDILLCFTNETDLSLTEIAGRIGLHKSTAHRMLASLEGKGFVIRDPVTDKYKLGFRIWELAANLSRTDDPEIVLLPELERLRDELGETVSLYVRDGFERVRIQAVQSRHAVRRVAPVGARLPLYVGASSKILVAYAAPGEEQHLMCDSQWPPTIDKAAFAAQLADIRSQRYAMSFEERELGVAAAAAPIFNRAGQLVAALSVSGPVGRLTPDKLRSYAPVIIEAAERMGKMVR